MDNFVDLIEQDAVVVAKLFATHTGLPGQVSFSAPSGVSLLSLDGDCLAAPQSAHSSGESYRVKDRFALPGPTWCQQFAILVRRILWTRRFEILSLGDAFLVLVIAVMTGMALLMQSYFHVHAFAYRLSC